MRRIGGLTRSPIAGLARQTRNGFQNENGGSIGIVFQVERRRKDMLIKQANPQGLG